MEYAFLQRFLNTFFHNNHIEHSGRNFLFLGVAGPSNFHLFLKKFSYFWFTKDHLVTIHAIASIYFLVFCEFDRTFHTFFIFRVKLFMLFKLFLKVARPYKLIRAYQLYLRQIFCHICCKELGFILHLKLPNQNSFIITFAATIKITLEGAWGCYRVCRLLNGGLNFRA